MSTEHGPEEGNARDFTVNDRRGSASSDDAETAVATESEDALRSGAGDAAEGRGRPLDASSLPAIDFSTFLLSLSTSAMVHLGEVPAPDGQTDKNVPMARQTIDILEMLQEKTRGNLDDEESRLLEQLLYDLRLRYVAAVK